MSDVPEKIVLYPSKNGRPDIQLSVEDGTVWLTQVEIAELLGSSTANINIHHKSILEDGEQPADSVFEVSLIAASDEEDIRALEDAERQITKKPEGGK